MNSLIDFLRRQFETNQLFTGGAVLMAMGAILHYCRSIPADLWRRLKGWMITEIDIPDRDQAFDWVNQWLAIHPYGKRARLLTVSTKSVEHHQPQIILSPAPGTHYFFYKRRLVMLQRDRKDAPSAESGPASVNSSAYKGFQRESFVIKILSRDRNLAIQLLEDARELVVPKNDDRISLLMGRGDYWHTTGKRFPRPLQSVVLKEGQMESLLADIRKFQGAKQWYLDRGIPYRRGYLLKGPPGSGKTSAVVAIASELKLNIATISLSSAYLGDDDLRNLMAIVPERSLILLEDVDCIFHEREAKDSEKVTFSGLLNAIDGVAAGEGHVLFMTTNHPEKLDPALIRPGRADVHVEIGIPDRGQMETIFLRFFPYECARAIAFANAVPEEASMAAIQGHLLKYSDNPKAAVDHAPTLQL